MHTARHFYITTLPSLGELGSSPTMGLTDLIEHVAECRPWREQLEAVALLDDLLQRESALVGELEEAEPAVLSVAQVRGEEALPDELFPRDERELPPVVEVDRLWERYFRFADAVGRREGSEFLVEWVSFEVTLRNALARARARKLELDETPYFVALDLCRPLDDLASTVSEWESTGTPLEGHRMILRARWQWVRIHDPWFSFSVDELLTYAVRVMLLEQWRRTSKEEEL